MLYVLLKDTSVEAGARTHTLCWSESSALKRSVMTRKIVTDKLNTNHFLESSYSLCEDAVDAKRLHKESTEGKRETDTQKKRRYLSMKKNI